MPLKVSRVFKVLRPWGINTFNTLPSKVLKVFKVFKLLKALKVLNVLKVLILQGFQTPRFQKSDALDGFKRFKSHEVSRIPRSWGI